MVLAAQVRCEPNSEGAPGLSFKGATHVNPFLERISQSLQQSCERSQEKPSGLFLTGLGEDFVANGFGTVYFGARGRSQFRSRRMFR